MEVCFLVNKGVLIERLLVITGLGLGTLSILSLSGLCELKINPVYIIASFLAIVITAALVRLEVVAYPPQKIVLLALLSVISSGLRIIFAPIPSVQPSTFIIIMTGAVMGPAMGGFVGIMTPLLSNMFLGQGVHTPFMMAGWGFVGYLSGVFYPRVKNKVLFLYAFSIISAYLYGWITDLSMLLFYPPTMASLLLLFAMSFFFDTLHAAGNVLFLHILGGPVEAIFRKRMRRLNIRIL